MAEQSTIEASTAKRETASKEHTIVELRRLIDEISKKKEAVELERELLTEQLNEVKEDKLRELNILE